ncbi:DUF305 domain-containing protein [Streptomyces sp. Ncost-T10-10d]|uniref:DUF305 domain-containing protein n=1 Tax=Streptomyces sp. Ncost-T10-10d TaxID=1839774 RepID=UPI00081F0377|nr:protein of unknown function [Streptomyces sp. Ncost-T10-10d]
MFASRHFAARRRTLAAAGTLAALALALTACGSSDGSKSDGSSMPGMDHGSDGSGMPGMMSAKDMSDLRAAKSKDFDKKFAQLMIGHHEGAVTMAEDEQKNGSNADAKKLAGAVITAQTAEIEKMNKIIARL